MRNQTYLRSALVAVVVAISSSGATVSQHLQAQETPLAQVVAYRVELDGIEPFNCEKVKDVGVFVTPAPNRKPVPFKSKIRDIRLVKPFTKHRALHAWMHRAKNEQAEMKNGVIHFVGPGGVSVMRVKFVGAWLKSWELRPPAITKKGLIKEQIVLGIKDFELEYD